MTFWVAGAAIGGAVISSSAAGKAAGTQAASTEAGIAEQRRQYDLTRGDQAPYRNTGSAALAQYRDLLGITADAGSPQRTFNQARYDQAAAAARASGAGSAGAQVMPFGEDAAGGPSLFSQMPDANDDKFYDTTAAADTPRSAEFGSYARPLTAGEVQLDPGYEFARAQGQQGIDRKTAAAGGRISGAALKAAGQFNTDYATTGYSTAYNRQNQARSDRLNRLAALAGIGQTSVQQTGQAGASAGNAISNMTTAQGNASGAATLAQGNIWSGAGNQIAALYGRNSGGPSGAQAAFSQTGLGSSGFGTGLAYGNQDYGSYI